MSLDKAQALRYMLDIMSSKLLPFRHLVLALAVVTFPHSAAAADNWIEVRSPHFIVNTNAGEKEARKVAGQFEQIRQMFQSAFTALKVDPAQPIIIVAAKNENTMKQFLPEEWEVKGHIHHAGMYQAGLDKDYVILRLDTEGSNPFHTLYHEYTHALLRLNFSNLPIWLNEGLADFFGNSTLGDKEVRTGTIDSGHLYLLDQSKLIPIDTLLQVDRHSPYYNEADRASVFYAESWAVVHFLMLDDVARQKQLLKNFLTAWQKSGNQLEAAREAFGDLKQFGKIIEAYSRQRSFRVGVVKMGQEAADKNYAVRNVSPGEAMALRGDFFAHSNRMEKALPALDEAVRSEPKIALAHEALCFYHYQRQEVEEADKECLEAIRLGATGFTAPYFHGVLLVHKGGFNEESLEAAKQSLKKAIQLNPQFAPAYEGLSQAYARSQETQKEAISTAIKAVELDPGQLFYAVNLAYLLLGNSRFEEARTMGKRILAAASTPSEREVGNTLLQQVQQAEELAASAPKGTSLVPGVDRRPNPGSPDEPGSVSVQGVPRDTPITLKKRGYAVDGTVSEADCSNKPEIFLNVDLPTGPVTFHAADFGKVSLSWADGVPQPLLSNCTQWRGRQVKVWFSATPGKEYAGEISKIYFF